MFSFLPPGPSAIPVQPLQSIASTANSETPLQVGPTYPSPALVSNASATSSSQWPTSRSDRLSQAASSTANYAASLVQDDAILQHSLSRRRRQGSVDYTQAAEEIVANNVADPFGALSGSQAATGYTVRGSKIQRTPVIELERRLRQANTDTHSMSDDSGSMEGKSTPQIEHRDSHRLSPLDGYHGSEAGPPTSSVPYSSGSGEAGAWHAQYQNKMHQFGAYGSRADVDSTISDAYPVEEEEDSPFPEVRASVSNVDDPDMPVLTARVWLLGGLLCIFFSGLNLFFTLRYPAPYVTSILTQIIAYPLGKLLAAILPTHAFKTPQFLQSAFGVEDEWSFNPGPFSIKEHAAIIQMSNAAITPAYALYFTVTLDKFYNIHKGVGFDLLIVLSTQMIGFAFAGICRRFLVWPAGMLWPSNLVTCTLLNTFHAEEDDGRDGGLTRFRFFGIVTFAAGLWYLFPNFLFVALSVFSYVCWAAPNNVVINQLFGVSSGMGMGVFTFDWSQISYIGSPLIVPFWAIVNIFGGFALIYWIIVPALYYTNVWHFAHLPMWGTDVYDRFSAEYDVTRVIDSQQRFNTTAYHEYSPLYMPVTYVAVYSTAFALATAVLVHTALFHGKSIVRKIRNVRSEAEDIHAKLMRNYPEVPDWWYLCYLLIYLAIAITCIEIYDTDLPVWGLLVSLLLAAIYVLPGGFIFAMTSQEISVNLLAELIPGFLFIGKPVAVMAFKTFSVQSLLSAFTFVQDLKLGHYMKVPPRTTFAVQVIAALLSGFTQVAVKRILEAAVPDLCADQQASNLVCPQNAVFYSSSIIWGLIGPQKTFGTHALYRPMMWFMLAGALLPIPFWMLAKRWPRSWFRFVHIPVLLAGASYIPPATGINYSSWFLVGFIFQYIMRRHRFRWWSKFNFVLSASLEGGTIISGILIFLILQLPKQGQLQLHWWGNNVYKHTLDYNPVPLHPPGPEGFGPDTW